MILAGMYPTEWDLAEEDKEALRLLLGMSAAEWKRAHEGTKGLAKGAKAGLHSIVSPARESEEAESTASFYGRLAPAQT